MMAFTNSKYGNSPAEDICQNHSSNLLHVQIYYTTIIATSITTKTTTRPTSLLWLFCVTLVL